MRALFFMLMVLGLIACSSDETNAPENPTDETLYFPPLSGTEWATSDPTDLGWNTAKMAELESFLTATHTEAFLILHNGKIAYEAYFNGKTATDVFPWNSAGKTLTAFTVGIAAQQNLLDLNDKTTAYLGRGWTSMSAEQEDAILIKNQLTMTSGGDFTAENTACYDPECLQFKTAPDTEWYYYNAYYTLLQPVLDAATSNGFESFFENELKTQIGLDGRWVSLGYNNVYFSTARSMARFGLLNLSQGNWDGNQLLNSAYYKAMTTTSQELNPAYGYLWWLNGKARYKLPGSTQTFSGKLIPNAPVDLIAGLGANDKKLYVIPSKKMVIIRLGPAAYSEDLGPTSYDNDLWSVLNEVF
ncbi:MAG TPA: serine hydrolase [Leeuwenhoekiella sp.]|uniref:serine hydrolase domain-containing protein n=1 Tax=Leeuwenhoekiella palythoae TaxID=573501 RepID=UPI000C5C0585|nr:serine hydrolase [Leeuwenhoekiella palythoae]MAS19877.1 serine hydrolase [Leeuwenhoekiella sp.]MBH12455.1 serine hydrolase [Leeuwenhoekiella sp.]UBZ09869.1 serine hydrolase [Leeuwenhoekiella palythoae]HAX15181.1 serine hydrolase [Leeuwenhoekiella sp.]HBO30766.1 serine hydrolase [Leeuwenhoekiella sp.]|tara:strand:- start:1775 stop:2848 length:1074 start_codon:yes stop_codon:yes gene_type:complete